MNNLNNLQALLQMQMRNNPRFNEIQTQIINMQRSSGMNSRDFAIQFAKQNGISQDQLMAIANRMGLK